MQTLFRLASREACQSREKSVRHPREKIHWCLSTQPAQGLLRHAGEIFLPHCSRSGARPSHRKWGRQIWRSLAKPLTSQISYFWLLKQQECSGSSFLCERGVTGCAFHQDLLLFCACQRHLGFPGEQHSQQRGNTCNAVSGHSQPVPRTLQLVTAGIITNKTQEISLCL